MAQALLAKPGRLNSVATQTAPPEGFDWPEAIVFVDEDCSLYRSAKNGTANDSLTVTVFNPRGSRAFPEHDLPGPIKVGRKLMVLSPAKPGVTPRLLLDAEGGALGSPSVTFDGKSILVSMAKGDDDFFHIYRIPAEGGKPEQLTDGPFHDIDPAQLPDGRIVFTSTRIGTFEEYHAPPSRSLFAMNTDGGQIEPLTHTIIFDNEPEVLADGRIVFIRSDNFFDRGKVETRLHAIHPDGTRGQNVASLDIGAEYGNRLRAFLCGSPAPLDDGRLAYLSGNGITVERPGARLQTQDLAVAAGDVASLPDARLLCTTVGKLGYQTIQVLDIEASPPTMTPLYHSPETALHSPVFLGARRRPPVLPGKASASTDDVRATGFLFCQNARLTKNTAAGWEHVRAIRVLAAQGLTTRSSHSYIVHSGSDVKDLGTVPLAPDGSFHVEVPANTPIAFQAVDAEGRSELNEMSWIYVRPGETQSCVGCHESQEITPTLNGQVALALKTPPLKLLPYGEPHRFRGNNPAVTGLMELQFDRFREVAGINRHGESVGSDASGAQEVEALVAHLRGDNRALRISSTQRLAIFRAPAAAQALAECLADPSREVGVAAAMALAACGTRESVPPLLEALTHREPLVAQAAVVALENLTGHVVEFNAFASQDERTAQAGAWRDWFVGTTWRAIEAELVKRIGDADRNVVRRAAVALGHTGGEAGRVALREYVAEHQHENPYPAWQQAGHRGDNARFNSLEAANPRCLQAAVRSLGYLGDGSSAPMLAKIISEHHNPDTGNLFLAEAAVEALGRIGTPEAEHLLITAFESLGEFPSYTRWYGDHDALMACHASPIHYLIVEALDALGSMNAGPVVGHLIRSIPIDPDRALLLSNDDFETLAGRVIRRSGMQADVVETALSILGDSQAKPDGQIAEAIGAIPRCWAGHPCIENRAAQILSLVCRDPVYEPRIRAALGRYLSKPTTIKRVFDTGIPVVQELPVKNWVCFYLARTLGNLEDSRSVETLIAVLEKESTEAAGGRPDPLGPGVHFLHNGLTPCYRAAAAWALGRISDRRATVPLLRVVGDLENATDTRHAAAVALGVIGDPSSVPAMRQLAEGYQEVSTRQALLTACVQLEEGDLQP
ncbi:MAG: HEAT repeat domain-containing protein [Planctomycetota bacterium]